MTDYVLLDLQILSITGVDSFFELKKCRLWKQRACSMQRHYSDSDYEEFSCEWSTNKERNHCLTFSTWPRTCERTQSQSCRHQPNRTVAFSSKESTRKPTEKQKLEQGQHVEYRKQGNENIKLLNNDVIFNATKNTWQNDTLRGWQALLHHFRISMRKLTVPFKASIIYSITFRDTDNIFQRLKTMCKV